MHRSGGRSTDLSADDVLLDKAAPAALKSQLEAEIAKWGPIIQKAGLYAD